VTGSARTAAAMSRLGASLRSTADELQRLAHRADVVADAVGAGEPLSNVITAEPGPLVIARLAELLDELADAGAQARRAEAAQLHAEGLTQGKIAKIFGVTRQRVSVLLAPPPPPEARAAKRPRRT
jgi:hypothetical protein